MPVCRALCGKAVKKCGLIRAGYLEKLIEGCRVYEGLGYVILYARILGVHPTLQLPKA